MQIGVLDIQGSVKEHFEMLKKCKVSVCLVKNKEQLSKINGLIIPGGESTVIGKLLKEFDLKDQIILLAKKGMPIWGTCAGAILLAKKIKTNSKNFSREKVEILNLMNIEIERNAYGRQIESFETKINFQNKEIPAIFIRAPKIINTGKKVQILAELKRPNEKNPHKKEIIAAREKNFLATTFHPELTNNLILHKYFIGMVSENK